MKALGAFIFAGGFTLGIKRRFDVLAHFEGSDYGVATAKANWPSLPVHYPKEKWPVDDPAFSELDLLYGNPPCAAWSVAGYTRTKGTDKWRTDPRVECTVAHFGLMKRLLPKVWVWESVTQAYSKGAEFVRTLEAEALALGYSVTHVLHDAQHLGLPQVRRRFFMVCHRVELTVPFPNWAPPATCMDLLRDLRPTGPIHRPKVNDQFDGRLHEVKPGERLSSAWERILRPPGPDVRNARGQIANRPSFGHCRLDPAKPANAVVGYMMIHPVEDRWMATNELQALCGFPQDWKWAPDRPGDIASEMARGVCPTVGAWLADAVAVAIANGRPVQVPTVTEVDIRKAPGSVTRLDPKRPLPAGKVTVADEDFVEPQEEPVTPQASILPVDHYSTVAEMTGLDRSLVKRAILALGYTRDLGRIAKALGCQTPLVEQVAFALEIVRDSSPKLAPATSASSLQGPEEPASPARRQSARGRSDAPRQERAHEPAGEAAIIHTKPILPPNLISQNLKPEEGEGSGAFIRRLLMLDRLSPEEIVSLVLASYEGRKTTVKDVRWNYDRLRTDGKPVPEWRGPAPKGGYPKQGPQHPAAGITAEKLLTPNGIRPRLLLTGATAMQVGSEKTQLKIITAQASWRDALTALGYDVDWRPVVPGEDLSAYARVVVAMNKGTVRTATHFYGTVWAISRHRGAVMAFDDWQTRDVLASCQSFSRLRERAFRLGRANQAAVTENEDALFRQVEALAEGDWPCACVVPTFRGGDLSLLGIPSRKVVGIDPTVFAKRYPATEVEKERKWVLASLLDKKRPRTGWPLVCFGNPDKKGGQGAAGPEAQPRLEEPALMGIYCGARGVISPAHPHAGSGWWRVRYLMAADAGCVLSADLREAKVLGDPYVEASDVGCVERMSNSSLDELAQDQAKWLGRITMPRDEVLDLWKGALS